MKSSKTLIIIAFSANLLSIISYLNAADQPGGTGALMGFLIWTFPTIWIITFALTVTLCLANKSWFKLEYLRWTLITLPFCTPIPFAFLLLITSIGENKISNYNYTPAPYQVETNFDTIGKFQIKYSRFIYSAFHDS